MNSKFIQNIDEIIKSKKSLLITIALFSGLMLGIFGAFFKEFVISSRNDH